MVFVYCWYFCSAFGDVTDPRGVLEDGNDPGLLDKIWGVGVRRKWGRQSFFFSFIIYNNNNNNNNNNNDDNDNLFFFQTAFWCFSFCWIFFMLFGRLGSFSEALVVFSFSRFGFVWSYDVCLGVGYFPGV